MDDTVAITLFRHGLTEANERKEYLGWTDSPLTKESAPILSSVYLDKERYDLFVSSDLERCKTTMNFLFKDISPLVLTELREMNFGKFEGKSYEQLKNNPKYWDWIDHMFTKAPPNGESYHQFIRRVDRGWDHMVDIILQRHKKNAFVVTHGGVIRYLLSKVSGEDRNFWEWKIAHGNGYVLTFKREGLRRGEPCILLQEVPLTGNAPG